METYSYPGFLPKWSNSPLPSGKWNQWKLERNSNTNKRSISLVSPASLWEVESMETLNFSWYSGSVHPPRFPLGSGINGNFNEIRDKSTAS
ncbi:hypothetical protein CRC_03136 [Cylindrospermopsis raciborskii CS-505]|nr:hypothetical protein CRC_03136 [Cylindrospermopsis raciborskii CS-505]